MIQSTEAQELKKQAPDHEEILTMAARIVHSILKKFCSPTTFYDKEEIYKILKGADVDARLGEFGILQLSRFNTNDTTGKPRFTALQLVLRNLWCNGMIEKHAKGIYIQSGRPTGVHWRVP